MQTTLLSIAIALILALLAALLGPYVIRWNDHRAFFEAEASRLVGTKVLVGGDIDATMLPSPAVTLRAIAIGPAGQGSRLRAKSLRIELALGPLLRGEMRATEMKLVSPQFNLGLDDKGQIDWPSLALADETLSIDRLSIEDGHATLADAVSKSRLELDHLWFTGEVRSLTGPIRGKGEFVTTAGRYGYEVSAAKSGPEGTRLRLSIQTNDRPLTAETEGLLAFDKGAPKFEGTLALSRLAGAVLAGGKGVTNEPWKLTTKVHADGALATFDEVSFQYGSEERALTLAGSAQFKFGAQPQMEGALAARQVDLDRLLATPEMPRHLPLAGIQSFGEMLSGALRPSWPVKLAVNVDAMTLGGSTVQNVGSDIRSDGNTWTVERLELRAPGYTQIRIDGRLYPLGTALGFAGAASLDSSDPKNFVAWLAGRSTTSGQYKPWRVKGDVTLRSDRIAVEHMRAELDRGVVEGSISYAWSSDDHPARLDGELRAADLDLDGVIGFGESAFSGLGLERPGEIGMAVDIGHAKIAGFDAREIAARLKLDAGGLSIEKLSVGDIGSTSFVATGRIQTQSSPGGSIAVNLDSRDLNGMRTLAERFMPVLAEPLGRIAARQKTATMQANVSMESSGADGATGKVALNGKLGTIQVNLSANASGRREAFVLNDLGVLSGTDVRIDGQLQADDDAPLFGLIGLDRAITPDKRSARLNFSVSGPLGRELQFKSNLQGGTIDANAEGTVSLASNEPATLDFRSIDGTVGGSGVRGRGTLRLSDTPNLEAAVEVDEVDFPAAVVAALGIPRRGKADPVWSTDPIAWTGSGLTGRIAFKARRAVLTPWLIAEPLSGNVSFNGSEAAFENLSGALAQGQLDGRFVVSNSSEGLTSKLHVSLTGAELGALFANKENSATTGRLSVQADVEGVGRSPAAFIGSLSGSGSVSLEKARIAGLNPNVFGAVTRAQELGIPTDGSRLQRFVSGALDSAGFPIANATAGIGISSGQARLRDVAIKVDGADLQANVNVNLSDATLDGLLTLNGPPDRPDAPRPAVLVTLNGALPVPKRSLDIALLTSWLTLRNVERQSKQLEVMEQAARDAAAAKAAEQKASEQPASQAPETPAPGHDPAPAASSTAPAAGSSAPSAAGAESNGAANAQRGAQPPALPAPIAVPAIAKPRAGASRANTATTKPAAAAPPSHEASPREVSPATPNAPPREAAQPSVGAPN